MPRKEDLHFGLKKKGRDGKKDVRIRSLPLMICQTVMSLRLFLILTPLTRNKRETTLGFAEVSLLPAVEIVNDRTQVFFFLFE